MKTNTKFLAFLKEKDACSPAIKWLGNRTPQECYNECERADWLLWWFYEATKEKLQGYPTILQLKKCALEIARKALQFTKDENVKIALDMVEDYLNTGNLATIIEARKILKASRDSARKNYSAAAAADAAAYAAAYAYEAAYADAYSYAAEAAYEDAYSYAAAGEAAYAAAYADAAEARKKMNKESADLVRSICGQLTF